MSAFTLRLVACLAMLMDHIGYQYGLFGLRLVGRIAFPIFVFLLVNGLRHTSSPRRYALRLGVFALLSQVPFSLFGYGQLWNAHGNVLFTLFLALVALIAADCLARYKVLRWLPALGIILLYDFGILSSDYGARGILLALVICLTDGRPALMALGMGLSVFYPALSSFLRSGVPQLTQWELWQLCSLFSLPLLYAYNGQKGGPKAKTALGQKLLQYGFYAFYPMHQLILWLIR